MSKPRNTQEELARKAAARLEDARRTGEQLSLLPVRADLGIETHDRIMGHIEVR